MPYVYVARRSDGRLKVGYSTRPSRRKEELRTQFGMTFSMIRTWKHDRAVNVETVAHRLLVAHRDPDSQGIETYNANETVVIEAVKEAIWRFDRGIFAGVPTRPWPHLIHLPPMSPEGSTKAVREWLAGLGIENDDSPEAFAVVDQWIMRRMAAIEEKSRG
jgi:hypothetical protein